MPPDDTSLAIRAIFLLRPSPAPLAPASLSPPWAVAGVRFWRFRRRHPRGENVPQRRDAASRGAALTTVAIATIATRGAVGVPSRAIVSQKEVSVRGVRRRQRLGGELSQSSPPYCDAAPPPVSTPRLPTTPRFPTASDGLTHLLRSRSSRSSTWQVARRTRRPVASAAPSRRV